MKKQKVMLLLNDTTYAYNLRREVIQRLAEDGHEVVIACELLLLQDELRALGCRLIPLSAGRHGTNPLQDLRLLMTYVRLLREERPDVVLSYNIKPNVYGGLACRMLGIRYMPNVTGLGTAVENPGKMQMLTTRLYKWGVAGAECVFFQNEENERFFRERSMLSPRSRTCLLPGSGVSLQRHPALPFEEAEEINFLFVARVMKEKGIDLYLAAAKAIHEKYGHVMFHICGMCDDPRYEEVLREAGKSGYIRYHGQQKNMTPFLQMAHCLVHPSYYPEGMSNVLLEAAASARPIIATDRSGCRETVDDGVSGYVVPVKDEEALIAALERFMQLSWEERRAMGQAGRAKMEREFDRQIVVDLVMKELERA